jgi:hypothetical protein
MEGDGGALLAILPGFEIVEELADIGEEEVADLGLILERRLAFRKGVLQVPALAGKGKARPGFA